MLAIILPSSGPKTWGFEGLTSGCAVTVKVNRAAGRRSFKSQVSLCVLSVNKAVS